MIELVPGVTYYALTFADPAMTMPGVEPLVYVGVDVFDDDVPGAEKTHYFQTTVSYMRFGPATNPHTEGEIDVVPFTRSRLDSDVFTLQGIADAVSAAAVRGATLDYPRLKSSPGNWKSMPDV